MTIADQDTADVVYDLVHTGRTWAGNLPPEFGDTSLRRRIKGAAFSVLVMIDGDGGPGPVQLSPKGQPDVDLGGEALHELFSGNEANADNDHQRELLTRIQELVDHSTSSSYTVSTAALGGFVGAVCRMLADHYELRLVDTDEDGYYVAARDDIAPALPAAFSEAWNSTITSAEGTPC
jgi:hypothetical protein